MLYGLCGGQTHVRGFSRASPVFSQFLYSNNSSYHPFGLSQSCLKLFKLNSNSKDSASNIYFYLKKKAIISDNLDLRYHY